MQENFVEQFSTRLMAALEQFDTAIPPFGLYTSNETGSPAAEKAYPYREWDDAVKPFLVSERAAISTADYRPPVVLFRLPNVGDARLEIIRLSKIKIRQYGSRYYVDKHVSFGERWAELKLDDAIRGLWKPPVYSKVRLSLLLLMSFDKSASPLHQELAELEKQVHWDKHDVNHTTTQWPDRYERGFSIGLSLWARYDENGIDAPYRRARPFRMRPSDD